MATHRHIKRICLAATALALLLCAGLYAARAAGVRGSRTPGYQTRLFDTGTVHSIDIRMEDWEAFLAGCEDEEYVSCAVLIDNELYKNIGLRAKGNTSLSQVSTYGNGRYSFKLEFDHYEAGRTYYGLDKLCLNNLIQDNTLLKDYLCYAMMADMGVGAPLCSYVWVTVNGEAFGLYLAVEAVEDSFLYRSYGAGAGELYKPDSVDMGGGRGAGRNFVWQEDGAAQFLDLPQEDLPEFSGGPPAGLPEEGLPDMPDMSEPPADTGADTAPGNTPKRPGDGSGDRDGTPFGGAPGGFGAADDVLLQYIDDEPDSYPNIFENAKTAVTDADRQRLITALRTLNESAAPQDAVDTDQVIRYFAVHNFVCNFDSYTGSMVHNYYLYEQDGRLSMLPWDYNLAFGGFSTSSSAQELVNYPIDTPVSGQGVDARPMLRWIFADDAYTAQYHAALQQLVTRWFDEGRFAQEIERLAALLDGYVAQDTDAFCSYAQWQQGLQALRQFGSLRAQSVRAQLTGEIPAAQEDRSASDALVDTGSLSIGDMGGMGGMDRGADGGGGNGGPRGNSGGGPAPSDGEEAPQAPPDFAAEDAPFGGGERPQAPPDLAQALLPGQAEMLQTDREAPPPAQAQTAFTPAFWLLTGLCAAALAGGFALARRSGHR